MNNKRKNKITSLQLYASTYKVDGESTVVGQEGLGWLEHEYWQNQLG